MRSQITTSDWLQPTLPYPLLDSVTNAGTAVFVLNIGDRSEVWSSPLASPKGGAFAGYASQGPLAVSASSVYGMPQPAPVPVAIPVQQVYQQPQQVSHRINLLALAGKTCQNDHRPAAM